MDFTPCRKGFHVSNKISMRRVAVASVVGAVLLVLLFTSGCASKTGPALNSQTVLPRVDAHIEALEEAGISRAEELITADILTLVGGATISGPLTAVSLVDSLLVGLPFLSTSEGETGNSYTHFSFGEADLRVLGKDEEFLIEVVADLTNVAGLGDLVDNRQIQLEIDEQSGTGLARLEFKRRILHGYGYRWDTVQTVNLPIEEFLGVHTFAGRWANNRMEVLIDGVVLAEKYSPNRTRPTCEVLEVGKGCFGRIGTVALCPPDHDPVRSFEAITMGDELVRGDVNQDGSIDAEDYALIRDRILLGSRIVDCEEASDVNDDGEVNMADVTYLIQMVNNNGPVPPEPFNVVDVDRDEDGLTCLQFRGL